MSIINHVYDVYTCLITCISLISIINLLSDEWNQAEKLMSKYKSILTRREDLKSEVALMEEKNLKLEQELESKLKEQINEDLAFPPTKILSVGDKGVDSKK